MASRSVVTHSTRGVIRFYKSVGNIREKVFGSTEGYATQATHANQHQHV